MPTEEVIIKAFNNFMDESISMGLLKTDSGTYEMKKSSIYHIFWVAFYRGSNYEIDKDTERMKINNATIYKDFAK